MSKNYDFKDAFMILKAVAEKANEIYKSKNEMMINQLLKLPKNQYNCEFGLLNLKTNAEKTIKEYTEEEKAKINILQAQINVLQAQIDILGTEKVIEESYKSLVYHKDKNGNAQKEAEKLLKDLILAIGNASMIRAANSNKRIRANKKANIK